MKDLRRRRIDVVTDPAYVEGLKDKSVDQLKEMQAESTAVEQDVSFERQLCLARMDIIEAELEHRAGRAGPVMERLPEILGKHRSGAESPMPGRAPDLSIPTSAQVDRRRVDEIAGEQVLAQLDDLSEEELGKMKSGLKQQEESLSNGRRAVHGVLDRIKDELLDRGVDPQTLIPRSS